MGSGRDQRSVEWGGSRPVRSSREYRTALAWGLVLSVGLHVAFLPLLGRVRIPGLPHVSRQEWPLTTVRLPPAVQIPEPPAPVVHPALPLPPENRLARRPEDPHPRIAPTGGIDLDPWDAPPRGHGEGPLALAAERVEGALDVLAGAQASISKSRQPQEFSKPSRERISTGYSPPLAERTRKSP